MAVHDLGSAGPGMELPLDASVRMEWWPDGNHGGQSLQMTAVDKAGLPVLLVPEQQMALLAAFIEQANPEASLAVEGFRMAQQLLGHVVGRLEVEPRLVHPDGDPVVSDGWLDAAGSFVNRPPGR